jgi:hypothetical protein
MKNKVRVFWLIFALILVIMCKYIFADPSQELKPYCLNNVMLDTCRKCPQGAYCGDFEITGCKNGYLLKKPWSIFGGSKTLCKPDVQLKRALRLTAENVVSQLRSNTMEKHCKEFDLSYREGWTIGKLEQVVNKVSIDYEKDSLFTFTFKNHLNKGQFESMGLFVGTD